MDEVLAVGDASFRQKCLSRIHSLLDNGTTIVFVSHNLHMVQAVCPSSLYIQEGRVKLHGSTADIISAYERDLQKANAEKLAGETGAETGPEAGSVEVTKVEVVDEAGAARDEFLYDQPVQILVHYNALLSRADVNLVVRIIRSDGLTCCRMRTRIDDVLLNLDRGTGTLALSLPVLQLTGASYYVTASIWTDLELIVLAEGKSSWFYVSGAQTNDSEYSGVFEPQRTWITNPHALPALTRD